MRIQFILYVADQTRSAAFYRGLLGVEPSLNVPGMTEFCLLAGVKLGLMPAEGIARIITPVLPHPSQAEGIPRCELYLRVRAAKDYMGRALRLGGQAIDGLKDRDWGDRVGYIADLDGHVVALAEDDQVAPLVAREAGAGLATRGKKL